MNDKKSGYLFSVNIAVRGETAEDAWDNFIRDPKTYLPEECRDRIALADKTVECFGVREGMEIEV